MRICYGFRPVDFSHLQLLDPERLESAEPKDEHNTGLPELRAVFGKWQSKISIGICYDFRLLDFSHLQLLYLKAWDQPSPETRTL